MLGEEQRANLSTPRLGHQTGRNQLLRREEEVGKEGFGGGGGGGSGNGGDGRLISFDAHALLLLLHLLPLLLHP